MNFILIIPAHFPPGDVAVPFQVFNDLKNGSLGIANLKGHGFYTILLMTCDILKYSTVTRKKCPSSTHFVPLNLSSCIIIHTAALDIQSTECTIYIVTLVPVPASIGESIRAE